MIFVFPIMFIGWKLIHKTEFYKPEDVDLKQDLAGIEEYTANFVPRPSK
jgi:yeast amino acid transporter